MNTWSTTKRIRLIVAVIVLTSLIASISFAVSKNDVRGSGVQPLWQLFADYGTAFGGGMAALAMAAVYAFDNPFSLFILCLLYHPALFSPTITAILRRRWSWGIVGGQSVLLLIHLIAGMVVLFGMAMGAD